MLLGLAINLIVMFGPLLLLAGLDAWLRSRDFALPRWFYVFPGLWAVMSGWIIYSCTLRDNCS